MMSELELEFVLQINRATWAAGMRDLLLADQKLYECQKTLRELTELVRRHPGCFRFPGRRYPSTPL